jgi:hypothetical protein
MTETRLRGNGFWRDLAFGTLSWMLRRGIFVLACGTVGALGALVLDGSAGVANGFVIGLVVGLGLLAAWFVLREL